MHQEPLMRKYSTELQINFYFKLIVRKKILNNELNFKIKYIEEEYLDGEK